jgi:hypothetical protein
VDPAIQWAGGQVPWILLSNGPADMCCGSCYPVGQRIVAVDPATQRTGRQVPWILLSNGPADSCRGSCYPMGRRIGAVDPVPKIAMLCSCIHIHMFIVSFMKTISSCCRSVFKINFKSIRETVSYLFFR